MYGTRTQPPDGLHMTGGAVALVDRKTVPGVLRLGLYHHPVPGDLGKYARGGYAETPGITLHDVAEAGLQSLHRKTVHQEEIDTRTDGFCGPDESGPAGPGHPHGVDLVGSDHTGAAGLAETEYLLEQDPAFPFRELLTVIHTGNVQVRRESDRTCDKGSRQGTPACFVDTGENQVAGPKLCVEPE